MASIVKWLVNVFENIEEIRLFSNLFTVPRLRKKIANFGRPVTVTSKKSDKYLKMMADT